MRCPARRPARGRLVPSLFTAVLSLAAAGCGGVTSRDSSTPLAEWPAAEDLRVGSVDGSVTLTWIRSIEVGPDGRMFTMHPTEQEVRMFAEDGTPMRTLGGRGDGPGEFQNAYTMGLVGDTLWVYDGRPSRFSQFDMNGELVGSFTVPYTMGQDPEAPGPPRPDGLLDDGTVYGERPAFSNQIAAGIITERVYMTMDRDGSVVDSLPGVAFGNNQWAVGDPDHPERGGAYFRQPYGDGPLSAFTPGEHALLLLDRGAATAAGQVTYRLTKLTFDGDTLFSRTYPYSPQPLTQAAADSAMEATLAPMLESGRMPWKPDQLKEWAKVSFYQPAYMPPVTDMKVGRDGHIWLRDQPAGESVRWTILTPQGEPMGVTTLPAAFTLSQADGPLVWGYERDDLDVTYLVRYRIQQGD